MPTSFLPFVSCVVTQNARDSRLAYGGNQFTGEPADHGLCVGNGYLLHSVNSALQVYKDVADGTELTAVTSLNEFYGFPPSLNRTDGTLGPFTFDIECHYDPKSNRWFHLAVDLGVNFEGENFQDLAVSKTGDPTGSWDIYRIPSTNDGSYGTPNHGCGGPCFGDFPHFAVNDDGVFITTNEFPFTGGFIGAQVYAISKDALLRGDDDLTAYLFNTAEPQWNQVTDCGVDGVFNTQAFTMWPAKSAGRQSEKKAGGVQYFVSSQAVYCSTGQSNRIHVWSLINTTSLNDPVPSLELKYTFIDAQQYAIPPQSVQKDGPIPFGNSVNFNEAQPIDSSDSRVLDVRFANNKLWAVLGTAAEVNGEQVAGVAWYILNPSINKAKGTLTAEVIKEGIVALDGEFLTYPAIGVTTSGKGVITVTCVGPNRHPSACYIPIDSISGAGDVALAAEGNAPQDGFTAYGGRSRWGDYSAAAVDGTEVYFVSGYIESR